MEVFVEWWDEENHNWQLSALPLWQYLWGRITRVISPSWKERRMTQFRHVPRKDIIFD